VSEARFVFLLQEDVVAAGGLDVAATIDVVEEALRLHSVGDTRLPSKSNLMWSDDLGSEERQGRIMAMPAYVGGSFHDAGRARHRAIALGEPDLGLSGSQNSRLQFSQRKT
jgi:ornithine cyclodeaminase/alanine dehydrogenase-like protein (mu-crystallin family)